MDLTELAAYDQGFARLAQLVPADAEFTLESGAQLSLLRAHKNTTMSTEGQSTSKYVVVVLPGGGYEFVSYREDRQVALAFARYGFDAAVLHYHTRTLEQVRSCGKGVGLEALVDVAQAIDNIRHNAAWGLQDRKIVLCGFSAGGHLAASLCTRYDKEELTKAQTWQGSLRPDGAILGYPVISAQPELTHRVTFECFTGSGHEEDWHKYSCELNVDQHTPPAFIWHTATDQDVPFGNAVAYAQAMWRCGNKAQLVIFPQGKHGTSLATPEVELNNDFALADPLIATWLEQAVLFVRANV